jgi:hypothetical protein
MVKHAPKPATSVQEEPIDGGVVASIALAAERVTSAQTLLSLRQLELQVLTAQIRTHFEEHGAYVVHEIDPAKGVVRRSLRQPSPPPVRNGVGDPSGTGIENQ